MNPNYSDIHDLPEYCLNKIGSLMPELDSISTTTEKEFIETGKRLQNFLKESKEVAEISSSVSASLSGESIKNGISVLKELLHQTDSYLSNGSRKFDKSKHTLIEISAALDEFSSYAGQFKTMIKYLKMLSISTKVESARLALGENGFETLAENVDELTSKINDGSVQIRKKNLQLAASVAKVNSVLSGLSKTFGLHTVRILKDSKESLESLTERYKAGILLASEISLGSRNIVKSIGNVVTAIQYQDITAQQTEHVKQSLSDLCRKLEDATGRDTESLGTNGIINEVNATCRLQAEQLAHSGSELLNAGGNIVKNLLSIEEIISGLQSKVTELISRGSDRNTFSLTEIEEKLRRVAESVTVSTNTEKQFAESMKSVTDTIAFFSEFLNEIDSISTDIELIALNASIRAARTGSDGSSLGIIAESIQKLSVDAKTQTASMNGILGRIFSAAGSVDSEFNLRENDQKQTVNVLTLEDIGKLHSSLDELDELNKGNLEILQEKILRLRSDIKATAEGIRVHLQADDSVKHIVDELNHVAELTFPKVSGSISGESLKNIRSAYTMESERDIHDSLTGSFRISSECGNPGSVPKKNEEDYLGDNIELF